MELKAFYMALLAVISVLLIGIGLIAIPDSGPGFKEVSREGVEPTAGVATVDNIDLARGYYEVCVLDVDADEQDYGSLGFEIGDGGTSVAIERDPAPASRVLDGLPYEVLCSFVIPRRDTYFYTVWANGTDLDGERFNLIITHEVTTYDQPTFLAGLSIIIADLLCLPLVLLFMRKQRQGPGE